MKRQLSAGAIIREWRTIEKGLMIFMLAKRVISRDEGVLAEDEFEVGL